MSATDIQAYYCDQGDASWFQYRAGAITASMFAEVRKVIGGLTCQQQRYVDKIKSGARQDEACAHAGYRAMPKSDKVLAALEGERIGDYSSAAHDYAFRLAIERISGQAIHDEQYQGYAARRGHELEPEARDLHSMRIGREVERVGVVRTSDGRFGASADGYVGKRIGCEYKCFTAPEKLRPILFDFDVADVRDQMQGGMWLTGRTEWHLGLYCPFLEPVGRELTIIVEPRDDDYIEALEQDLLRFDGLVEGYRDKLTNEERAA